MKNIDPQSIHDVVWLQTAFLGDIVLTTAAIQLLAQTYPHIRQHVITTSLGSEILSACPHLRSIHIFRKKGLGLRGFQEVKKSLNSLGLESSQTLLIQAHRSTRSSLLAQFLGWPVLTYAQSSLAFWAQYRVDRISIFHESVRLALLLEPLGISREKITQVRPSLQVTVGQDDNDKYDFPAPSMALAPGSVWATKRWPIEYFQALALKLMQTNPHLALVLLGSSNEKILTDQIYTYLQAHNQDLSRVFNLAGQTKIKDLFAIFPKLHSLVANDSSPIHFASAFNIPTIALFGSTVPALGFSPLAQRSRSLGVEGLACRPCSDHGPQVCPLGHFKCMKELSVDVVFHACEQLMSETRT